jgi:hypothetical protein
MPVTSPSPSGSDTDDRACVRGLLPISPVSTGGKASWATTQEVASRYGLQPRLLKFSGVKIADLTKPGALDKVEELGKQNGESGWCGECA